MRFLSIIVLFSILGLSLSVELDSTQLDSQWNEYKLNFGKSYGPEEEEKRKMNFLKSLQFIESHNKLYERGDVSHEVGLNQFSDWSSDEYNSMLLPKDFSLNYLANATHHVQTQFYAELPPAFDWRQQNKVTPVKSQGQCGSCWAFATVATIESAYLIRHNQVVSISEQQLVDCCKTNYGCTGGWVDRAMVYIEANGLETERDYPYMNRNQNCMNNVARAHTKINGYRALTHPATDEQIMDAIMNQGPVAVNIDASGNDFGQYRGGIISTGTQTLNHYVTAVGWGPGYWIIKNSWGTGWGEAGFGRVARGRNVRGFNQYLFYPLV